MDFIFNTWQLYNIHQLQKFTLPYIPLNLREKAKEKVEVFLILWGEGQKKDLRHWQILQKTIS